VPEINRNDIATYCDVLFAEPPPGTAIALRGLPENSASTRPYLIWLDANVETSVRNRAVVSFVEECAFRGLAAYTVPGFVVGNRAGNADVAAIRCLVVDIDSGDIAAKVSRASSILGTPSMAVWSGGRAENQKKTHLYWRLSGDISAALVTRLWGMAARAFGGDPSFDVGRAHQPIRIAGSLHRKAQPVVVEIAYTSDGVVDSQDALARLEQVVAPRTPSSGTNDSSDFGPDANTLGLSRAVPMDALPSLFVGHGGADITRFEAITRMIGMTLANIADVTDPAQCDREFGYFREWALTHVENVERDYDLRSHFDRLLSRERWKRQQPRRPRARRWARR